MKKFIGIVVALAFVGMWLGCAKREQKPPNITSEKTPIEETIIKEAMKMKPLTGKKVVMIIAQKNFRDEELLTPKQILESEGAEVTVASSSLGTIVGMLGAKVKADILVSEINVADYDAVIFVGGTGASEYWDNATAHKIAQEAVEQGKVLGAICIAPVTLAKAGVLQGKKATVWQSEKGKLTSAGCNYTGASVEVDGNIITADGPSSAEEFGKAIAKALAGK